MAVRPCPTSIICPGDEDPLAGDSPVSNYSSEGPEDQPVFLSLIFPREWNAPGCASLCTSTESQQAADECALAQNAQCPPATDTAGDPGGTPGTPGTQPPPPTGPPGPAPNPFPAPSPTRFLSAPQTCNAICADGNPFTYTSPGGLFSGRTQAQADALEHAYACDKAKAALICLGALLPGITCPNVQYSASVAVVTGLASGVTFVISQGSLPSGLTLTASANGFTIAGTPTTPGNSTFTVRATDSHGNHTEKQYTLSVLGFTTDSLPDGTEGAAYSFQLQVTGYAGEEAGTGTYTVGLLSGGLPSGISVDPGGLITGTPATGTSGDYPIELFVTDTASDFSCSKAFVLTIKVSQHFLLVWGPVTVHSDVCASQQSQSFVGNAFSMSGKAHAYYDPPGCAGGPPPLGGCFSAGYDATCVGTANYTGPALSCAVIGSGMCFNNQGGASCHIAISVWQDGNLVSSCVFDSTPGASNNIQLLCPFNLLAGVNSAIQVTVNWIYVSQACGQDETMAFSGYIQN